MVADALRAAGVHTIVLIGPHGAGKTTHGSLLAEHLGVPFHDEVGRRLREQALARDPNAFATHCDARFDQQVFSEELARDRAWAGPLRVVETWHMGNHAYASVRTPAVAERTHAAFMRLPLSWRRGVLVLPLRMSLQSAALRLSEPGSSQEALCVFFRGVATLAAGVAKQWGCTMLPPTDTGDCGVQAAQRELVGRVTGFAEDTSRLS